MNIQWRQTTCAERQLVESMLRCTVSGLRFLTLLDSIAVASMDDGGMGSLRFRSNNTDQVLGMELCAIEFRDVDGVLVMASINLDQYGDLFELDVWKVDFSPVQRFSLADQTAVREATAKAPRGR